MNMLNLLFEEDIAMQDAIEDADNIADENEDTIIGVIEDRSKDNKVHLFEKEKEVDYDLEKDVEDLMDDSIMDNANKDVAYEELEDLVDDDDDI